MKKILLVCITGLLLTAFTFISGLPEIISGIRAGSAASLSKYLDNSVEISISGKSNNYSKSQAEAVLRDFFSSNVVKSFAVIHQGESGGAQFCIGTLSTGAGTYRTTVNLRHAGDKDLLQEIKFDRQ